MRWVRNHGGLMMATAERDGVRLYFADEGEGPPVLFHTGGGGDGRMWEMAGYTAALPGYRHILMDHRGHGRSDGPGELGAHRIEEYVADVVAVLDAAQVDTAAFVGYSAGGSVGYRFAASHPQRCSALVAIGSFPEPEDDPAGNVESARHVRRIGMTEAMEQMSDSEDEPAPAWLIDHLATTDTEMFALLLEGWSIMSNGWDLLAAITCPALIICGEREAEHAAAQRAAGRMRDGRAKLLPGFGHLQAFWHSEVTAPLIREFLQESLTG
jgi:pimeloyl-ACP methyl ester carboxylesterase